MKSRIARSPSSLFGRESIQPKQSASSTVSGYGMNGLPVAFFHETSHAPFESWFRSSHARHSARVSASTMGRPSLGCVPITSAMAVSIP